MSKFTDDFPFFGSPRPSPPATLNMLLNELGVYFASTGEQRAAIDRWLQTNTPGPRLTEELRERQLAFTN